MVTSWAVFSTTSVYKVFFVVNFIVFPHGAIALRPSAGGDRCRTPGSQPRSQPLGPRASRRDAYVWLN